ncbi:MAG: carboxymuconolactone decarboxylase [Gammaproteobacteria bacterium]|nr:MAG: carboxymuconolactone decarboxylase [Gammaproteobacteria bacterium]
MYRLPPASPEELTAEARAAIEFARDSMGFTPNDALIMARWPALLQAVLGLVRTIYAPGTVDMELKRLVGLIASSAAGCRYCMAHNAYGLAQDGVARERIEAAWEFETSELFTAAERAALRYAQLASQSPAAVGDAEFAELGRHFDQQQILELTAVIALFGFLNRWNAALAVPLEDAPLNWAQQALQGTGWTAGPHAAVRR